MGLALVKKARFKMAVEDEAEDEVKTNQEKTKLSHKKWRRLLRKEKRRVKRQREAEKRKQLEEEEKWRYENDPIYRAKQESKERAAERKRKQDEEESKREEQLWLEKEALAQVAFKKMKEREERKERERLEQERRIKEEWEAEEKSKKEKEEKKKQEIEKKENAVFRELEKTPRPEQDSSKEGAWHNPLAPQANNQNYGTELDTVNCSFYLKTGACRFGERCSRMHPRLQSSVTLMIPYMYQDIRLSQTMLDEADHDTGLEFDEEEAYERYKSFFNDVLSEFEKVGKVVQFKVCCNHEPHLRGNVYVQFSSEEECAQAFAAFNGRWYAGKQLSCEYSPVTKWRSAICGLFTRKQCPRGKNCNFLHVYRNPGNAFRNMDRDDLSPGRTPYSERGSERSSVDWRRESREGSVRDRHRGESSVRRKERRVDYERGRSRDRSDWDHERYSRKDRDKRDRFGRDVERDRDRESHNGDDYRDRDHERYRDKNRDSDKKRDCEREKKHYRKRDKGRERRNDRDEDADMNKYCLDSEKGQLRSRSITKDRRKRKRHSDSENNDETQNDLPERLNVMRSRDDWSTSSDSEEDDNPRSKKTVKEEEKEKNSVESDESSLSSNSHHRKRKHRSSHKHHKKSKKKHKKHKHRRTRNSEPSDTENQDEYKDGLDITQKNEDEVEKLHVPPYRDSVDLGKD